MPQTATQERKLNQTVVRLMIGDLTLLEIDAFVFYAQHDLVPGAGYGNIISVRGGPSVQKELKDKGPLETCDVIISGAGNLKPKHIIHAVGPRFQEEGIEDKLRTTMKNCLKAAEEKGFEKIAFPPMGTGFYLIPLDLAARVMFETIRDHLKGETKLKEVIVCVLDKRDYGPFEAQFGKTG
ncbi:MAG: macro domain-containing protein [Planctomycetota bacterium]|jgi:O-acetyl-ADP-ribose deacetylase (regulator of RNase III)